MNPPEDSPWIKASASSGGGTCVELRAISGGVEIRDSKNPDGGTLHFTHGEWAAWLDGAKKGEFDLL